MTSWVEARHIKRPFCHFWCSLANGNIKYCHIISQDHEISHVTLWVQAPHEDILWIVCPHPAKYGWLRHCGSGDLMFLVLEERNSTCSRLNPPLLFICYSMLRSHTWNFTIKRTLKKNWPVWPMKKADTGHTLAGEWWKNKKNFCLSVQKER